MMSHELNAGLETLAKATPRPARTEASDRMIGQIMTSRVVTVGMDDSLEVVQNIFRRVRFHHVLVVDQDRLLGIISDRDLLKAVSPYVGTLSETPRDIATLSKRVHQIMSRNPVTIRPSTTIQEAGQLMIQQGVSCLPVLSAEETVLGLVTWKDLLKALLDFVP
jgi:acetoin utilization protein AcuB